MSFCCSLLPSKYTRTATSHIWGYLSSELPSTICWTHPSSSSCSDTLGVKVCPHECFIEASCLCVCVVFFLCLWTLQWMLWCMLRYIHHLRWAASSSGLLEAPEWNQEIGYPAADADAMIMLEAQTLCGILWRKVTVVCLKSSDGLNKQASWLARPPWEPGQALPS